jgi:hypothetical protein
MQVIYEVRDDLDDATFPILYKVYKNGEDELGRSVVGFSELPEGVGASYIANLKIYMSNLISLIPEKDSMTLIERSNIVKLVYAASHLSSYIPAELPTDPVEQ